MAPADIIPPNVQNWLFAGSIALFFAVVACWVIWTAAVRRKLQFSIRFLFILTLVWAIFLGILKTCDVLPCDFSSFHIPALSVPARGEGVLSISSSNSPSSPIMDGGTGHSINGRSTRDRTSSLGIALAILFVWHQLRSSRVCSTTTTSRNRWAGRFACIGRSMLTASALWLLPYLWLMPTILQASENDYQTKMAYLERPREYIDALNKIVAEVRAEQSWRKKGNADEPREKSF